MPRLELIVLGLNDSFFTQTTAIPHQNAILSKRTSHKKFANVNDTNTFYQRLVPFLLNFFVNKKRFALRIFCAFIQLKEIINV